MSYADALRRVRLLDGTEVASDSREWRDECLARRLLRLPLDERRAWLADWEQRHGPEAGRQLREAMRAVHEAGRMTDRHPQER